MSFLEFYSVEFRCDRRDLHYCDAKNRLAEVAGAFSYPYFCKRGAIKQLTVSEMQLSAFRQLQGTDCRPCDFTEADCPTDAADEVSRASLLQPLTWSALLWILSAVVTPL
eukprot:TRINITY_DN15360_c0_g1_i3.p1 TRINITY_DN15360_c0_g1~~TRINITY_DN15360_c0_g1_i3.p1  ORF type:complete len:110 (-),score=17.21 TRINITY_DN15360_c0_g1_i3:269-598(-)